MGAASVYSWALQHGHVGFAVSSSSDRGLVRKVNEDSFVAVPPLFLVADGMGGYAHGDLASQTVARVLRESLLPATGPATIRRVLDAVSEANLAAQAVVEDDLAGTTLAGIALVEAEGSEPVRWMAFNVGDSRVYRWDDVGLSQISVDHSVVQELIDGGTITPAEATVHPNRNVITRAMGIDSVQDPDIWLMPAGGSQGFLICSDGLTKELDDAAIAAVLAVSDSPLSHADRLVAAALAAGGGDNVTVVVVSTTISVDSPGLDTLDSLPAHLEETLPRP